MPEQALPVAAAAAAARVDVLEALRAATATLHERLDAGLPIARDQASLDDYVAHLRLVQPWLLALRQELVAGGADGPVPVVRQVDARLADLARDLADAGHAASALPRMKGPIVGEGTGTGGPAYAWGLAYVVEGSQLGGAVLHRRLRERLAPHPLRYLAGAGHEASVAARWRDFVQRLRKSVSGPAAVRQAERGARAAFEDLLARAGL